MAAKGIHLIITGGLASENTGRGKEDGDELRVSRFILTKDSGEVERFDSLDALQRQLERIDVENNEYLAWDVNGNAIALSVQEPAWLKIEPSAGMNQVSLKDCLEKYAAALGVDVKLVEPTPGAFKDAYEQIVGRKPSPSFWRRRKER